MIVFAPYLSMNRMENIDGKENDSYQHFPLSLKVFEGLLSQGH